MHTHTHAHIYTHTYQYKTVSAQSLLNPILAVHSSRTELRRQLMTRVTDSNWINLDSWRAEWPYTLWSHACHVFPRWGVLTVWMYHPSLQARKGGGGRFAAHLKAFCPAGLRTSASTTRVWALRITCLGLFIPLPAVWRQGQHQRRTIMRQSLQANIVYTTRLDRTEGHFFVILF